MQIDFSSNLGIQETTRTPEFLKSYEFAKLYNQALENEGKDPFYLDDDLQKYLNNSSPDTHPDSDWLSMIHDTALMQTYSLSASGGTY